MRSTTSDPRVETGSLQICGRCHAIRGKVPDRSLADSGMPLRDVAVRSPR